MIGRSKTISRSSSLYKRSSISIINNVNNISNVSSSVSSNMIKRINRNIVTLLNNSNNIKYISRNDSKINNNSILMHRCMSNVSYQTIGMPSLSPTMTHGTIASWLKKPGIT